VVQQTGCKRRRANPRYQYAEEERGSDRRIYGPMRIGGGILIRWGYGDAEAAVPFDLRTRTQPDGSARDDDRYRGRTPACDVTQTDNATINVVIYSWS